MTTSVCPSFFFGSPLYTLSSSVVLNSSLSSRTYLFCSLEKRSPKSNESRNVQQLACAILKCVNSLISNLCKPARNVTCVQYFTAFIEHKHWNIGSKWVVLGVRLPKFPGPPPITVSAVVAVF